MKNKNLIRVNEIFLSIQGESILTGFPTVFVRFTGCNLRCKYCDTKYSYNEGILMSYKEIFEKIKSFKYKRVCITGGEPLLNNIDELLLLLKDFRVTIETNGSILLSRNNLFDKHSFVMDIKTPSSGCESKNDLRNFDKLSDKDEIKFVISDYDDYIWSKMIINRYYKKGIITFSGVYKKINNQEIINWILKDGIDVRFQIQLHKYIWGELKKGV